MTRCLYTHYDGYPVIPKTLVPKEIIKSKSGSAIIEKSCIECGKLYLCSVTEHKRGARFCSKKCQYEGFKGTNNPRWVGDRAKVASGNMRAIKLYTLTTCIICGKPASDRHHKDMNTLNNSNNNIMSLCRRCHMVEDGRLERLKALERKGRTQKHTNCIICNKQYKPMRKGRCACCDAYLRSHGFDKPENYTFNPILNLGSYAKPPKGRSALCP